MAEASRSNRPTPRTPAAVEAELRRRVRAELSQAREQADGELDDESLAGIIARAVGQVLSWHLEAPEHSRNATSSSRSWRSAGGPRGGGRSEDMDDRPARPAYEQRGPRPPYEQRGPRPPYARRSFDEAGADEGGGFDQDTPYQRRPLPPRRPFSPGSPPRGTGRGQGRPPRDFDQGGQSGYDDRRPPRSGGGGFKRGGFKPGGGGGFGPRRFPRGRN